MTDKMTNQEDIVETTQTFKPVQDIPMNNFTIQEIVSQGWQGWQCPICKSILAPFVTECPCKGRGVVQETTSPTYVPKNNINLT